MAGSSRRRPGSGARRTGVVTRGELRGIASEPPRRDGLLAMGVIGMVALAVLVVLNGAFAAPAPTGQPTPVIEPSAAPTDPPFSPRPPGTASPSETPLPSPSAVPTATASPSPSPTPSPTPEPTPTPSPTPEPTPSPSPTPAPTPTAEPTPDLTPAPTPPPDGLIIVEPVDRSVASERSIVVRGLAPPGATITRDIEFWFDQHTTADANGRWSLAVELASGENLITLRLGDRPETQQTLVVYYSP